MNKIVIYGDSSSDLTDELLNEHDLKILPLYVTFGEDIYKDKLEINPEQLYARVEKDGNLPKTSAATMGDYYEIFKKELDAGNDVIFFSISSDFSSTINNARMARDELDPSRIAIIDSRNLSSGIGIQMLKADKFRKEGKSLNEIVELLKPVTKNARCKFAVDTLEYLHKGGRCSGASRLFGTLLQIKPIISVDEGKMNVWAKTKGKKKALHMILEEIISHKGHVDNDFIFVTHTYADDEAIDMKAKLEKEFPDANVMITNAGSVVSSHCGKGTIGVIYILKD